jgi:hypothetical protein
MKFRNNELSDREKEYIKDEWSAVNHGAEEHSFERFCGSLVWPVQICSHFVPSIVLMINKNRTKDTEDAK